ncbi:MAG TPA: M4 family metallopeptidase [Candidatus Binatia bacterium]|nr:M4 family metallopeptidase [Candidatus Binatia bacterium]
MKRCLATLLCLLVTSTAAAALSPLRQRSESGVQRLAASAGAPLQVSRSRLRGVVTWLRTTPGSPVPVAGAASAQARARSFLASSADVFGVATGSEFEVAAVTGPDEVGISHVRLRMTYRGVPVTGATFLVHLGSAGLVAASAVDVPAVEESAASASLTQAQAQAAAAALLRTAAAGPTAPAFARTELQILNPAIFGGPDAGSHLAWFLDVRGEAFRHFVWIDANTGQPLMHFDALARARDREVYDGQSMAALPGSLARQEGDGATQDEEVDDAYDYSGDTYDYFLTEHGRDSFDDDGAAIVSTVRHCPAPLACPFPNAFWDGTQVAYGEGFARADDINAHELTHAVTEHTAGLYYCTASGALNESFSDIFGEAVDLHNESGDDRAGVRWLVGEDAAYGGIRNMIDPDTFEQPASTQDHRFFCSQSCTDFDGGGVHINSGVLNHAFALTVDGGSFDGHVVTGIGLARAGRIFYRTLVHYLTETSGFRDAYDGLLQACDDLVGTAQIGKQHCNRLQAALEAVSLHVSPCPVCGDGEVGGSEQCDDGDRASGDGCDFNCTTTSCGNAVVTAGEECDDGNTTGGDMCRKDCKLSSSCSLFEPEDLPLAITSTSQSSSIEVSGLDSIRQVGILSLTGTHDRLFDLLFTLRHPQGDAVSALYAGCPIGDFALSLSDDATSRPPCPLSGAGIHTPLEPLWPLAQDDPNGTWTLELDNDLGAGSGTLQDWKLLLCDLPRPELEACGDYEGDGIAGGGTDEYDLVLTEPQGVRAEFVGDAACLDKSLLIHDSQGQLVARSIEFAACASVRATLDPGAYVLRVHDEFGSEEHPYTVRFTTDDCAECGNGELEGSEECDAGAVQVDGCSASCRFERAELPLCQTVASDGFSALGADHFSITLSQKTLLRLETSGVSGCPGDTVLELRTLDGALIGSDDEGGQGSCSLLDIELAAGQYAVDVSGFAGMAMPPYTVRMSSADCSVCGNAAVEIGEECDDGNGSAGDGCDDACLYEAPDGWSCPPQWYGDGECDCGCDLLDSDCPTPMATHCDFNGCFQGIPDPEDNTQCIPFGSCGDGAVGPAEECDDGNRDDDDGCDFFCHLEVPAGWTCKADRFDDGECDCGCSKLDADCPSPDAVHCDNNVCPAGDPLPGDNTQCTGPTCGDGFLEEGEQCEDGNVAGGDGCGAQCSIETVALTLCTPHEDDGITAGKAEHFRFTVPAAAIVRLETGAASGCPGNTTLSLLTDGGLVLENHDSGAGNCSVIEQLLAAGTYRVAVQRYDSQALPAYRLLVSSGACNGAVCGNSQVEPLEECDDDNLASDDGCSASCLWEIPAAWSCPRDSYGNGICDCGCGVTDVDCPDDSADACESDSCATTASPDEEAPASCVSSQCGNGIYDQAEECEDGNVNIGDGCDPLCLYEAEPVTTCTTHFDTGITGFSDTDRFSFTVTATSLVTLTTRPVSGLPEDTVLAFYTTNLQLLAESVVSPTSGNETQLAAVLGPGRYIAGVREWKGDPFDRYLMRIDVGACSACGDGMLQDGETCDDGAGNSGASGSYCSHACVPAGCGAPLTRSGKPSASDALYALKAAIALVYCDARVCDVSGNGVIAASDALLILRLAVGLPVQVNCASA